MRRDREGGKSCHQWKASVVTCSKSFSSPCRSLSSQWTLSRISWFLYFIQMQSYLTYNTTNDQVFPPSFPPLFCFKFLFLSWRIRFDEMPDVGLRAICKTSSCLFRTHARKHARTHTVYSTLSGFFIGCAVQSKTILNFTFRKLILVSFLMTSWEMCEFSVFKFLVYLILETPLNIMQSCTATLQTMT